MWINDIVLQKDQKENIFRFKIYSYYYFFGTYIVVPPISYNKEIFTYYHETLNKNNRLFIFAIELNLVTWKRLRVHLIAVFENYSEK